MSAIINKHKLIWQWSQKTIYLTKCLQQWRTNLALKTDYSFHKCTKHILKQRQRKTILKNRKRRKKKNERRRRGREGRERERGEREIKDSFTCQLHMNCYRFPYMAVARAYSYTTIMTVQLKSTTLLNEFVYRLLVIVPAFWYPLKGTRSPQHESRKATFHSHYFFFFFLNGGKGRERQRGRGDREGGRDRKTDRRVDGQTQTDKHRESESGR